MRLLIKASFSPYASLLILTLPVAEYYDTVGDRRVMSAVQPGYLKKLLPSGPPQEGEDWVSIQKDIETKIMPGLTHWYDLSDCFQKQLSNCLQCDQGVTKLHGLFPMQFIISRYARRAV